ncbi:MAG TPA: MFS transporter [Thermoplasmata archaeon]|nr:MFS transporter [Thermoplasmata archaeon]
MDRSLRLLTVGAAIRTLGAALYNPFLALFLNNVLGLGYLEISILIVILGGIQIPFGVLGGLLTDRLGHRRLILMGLAGEAVSTGFLGYSFAIHSLTGSIAAALVGGTITTMAGPAFAAYIADHTSGSTRTLGFTWYRVGFNAGFSVGVALGGLLIDSLGFAGAVYLAALIIAGAAGVLAFFLPPSPTDRALAEGGRTPRGGPGPEPPARNSMGQSLRLLAKDRVAVEVAVAFALVALVIAQWAVTFPLFVHNVLGISYAYLGLGLAFNGLIVVFAQGWTTRSVLGRRHTSIGIVGVALYALAFVALGAAGLWGFFPVAVFFVSVIVLTEGENLASIPQTTLPSNLSPKGETGAYNGVFQAIGGVAFLVAILIGGVVLTYVTNPFVFWILLTLPAVPAILLLRHAGALIPPEENAA